MKEKGRGGGKIINNEVVFLSKVFIWQREGKKKKEKKKKKKRREKKGQTPPAGYAAEQAAGGGGGGEDQLGPVGPAHRVRFFPITEELLPAVVAFICRRHSLIPFNLIESKREGGGEARKGDE